MKDQWDSLNRASDRVVIIAAWKANKISGDQAWDLFAQHNLWENKEDAFLRYAIGSEAVSIQRELWGINGHARSIAKRLIVLGHTHGVLSIRAVEWLLDLFAAKME